MWNSMKWPNLPCTEYLLELEVNKMLSNQSKLANHSHVSLPNRDFNIPEHKLFQAIPQDKTLRLTSVETVGHGNWTKVTLEMSHSEYILTYSMWQYQWYHITKDPQHKVLEDSNQSWGSLIKCLWKQRDVCLPGLLNYAVYNQRQARETTQRDHIARGNQWRRASGCARNWWKMQKHLQGTEQRKHPVTDEMLSSPLGPLTDDLLLPKTLMMCQTQRYKKDFFELIRVKKATNYNF